MNPLADLPRVGLDGWKARIAEAETVEEVAEVEGELARAAREALEGIQARRLRRDLRAAEMELLWDELGELEAAQRNGRHLCRKRREALCAHASTPAAPATTTTTTTTTTRRAISPEGGRPIINRKQPTTSAWARLDHHEGN
jgi:hypothetical protein